MRPEYEAIVAAGLTLQLDSPDLGLGRHMMYKDRDDTEYLTLIERQVAVLNHALRNVAASSTRMHVCWGNYEGPHHRDVEMATILPVLLKAKPAGLLFETANPRHQHDLEAFADQLAAIPEDKVLIPGVIDTTTSSIRASSPTASAASSTSSARTGWSPAPTAAFPPLRALAPSTPRLSTPSWPPLPRGRRSLPVAALPRSSSKRPRTTLSPFLPR